MRGHIRKRGRSWTLVIDTGVDESGRRKQQWRGGFATKREAERALAESIRALETGSYIEPTVLTVSDFLDRQWLPAISSTVRPTTFLSYQMSVRRYLKPAIGSKRLQKVTAADLNAMYGALLTSGSSDGKALAVSTVRRLHAVTHRAFKDAARWGLIVRNPVDLADPPRQTASARPEMQTWTAEEAATFLRAQSEDRLYALWLLLLTTGLRRGEAAGLRWQDLDVETRRLAVRTSRVTVGHRVDQADPKSARSRRVVVLDRATASALRLHRIRQTEERLAWGEAWTDSGTVFTYEDGRPLHPNYVSKRFDNDLRRAGLRRIRLHDLRHTYATLALQAGVHPKIVSERLGHATVAFTLDVYSHVTESLQEESAGAVAALIAPR